jgi:M6 family metalloprotease-like protein
MIRRYTRCFVLALLAAMFLPVLALALEPPTPGMIERMKREGTYDSALAAAKAGSHYSQNLPRRTGIQLGSYTPEKLAQMLRDCLGASISDRSAAVVRRASGRDNAWMDLDLNRDGYCDERDLLMVGRGAAKSSSALPSTGTRHMFVVLVDFNDYPAILPKSTFDNVFFGENGDPGQTFRGLRKFYLDSSRGQLDLQGEVFGWYRAPNNRTYYHGNNNNNGMFDALKQRELVLAALEYAKSQGCDFSLYDNDGNGSVEEFAVIWSGPRGDWSTFWWAKNITLPSIVSISYDGYKFPMFSWQPEVPYGFTETPPANPSYDPRTMIHETGHGLGLEDLYDYDDSVGPKGGVGGMDMMDYLGDHCAFHKYILGWITPRVITPDNLWNQDLQRTIDNGDAAILARDFDGDPYGEYFMVERRAKTGYDDHWYYRDGGGLLIWHINAARSGGEFVYNNSDSDRKLVRLMEADGAEEIETGDGGADPEDFYIPGMSFTPTSTPSSLKYDGSGGLFCIVNPDDGTQSNATLLAYPTLSGRVVDDAGNPFAGVTLNLSGPATATAASAADGTFSFEGVWGAGYAITPSADGFEFFATSQTADITAHNVVLEDFAGVVAGMPRIDGFSENDGAVFGVVPATGDGATIGVTGAANANRVEYTLDLAPAGPGAEDPPPAQGTEVSAFPVYFALDKTLPNQVATLTAVGYNDSKSLSSAPKSIKIYIFNQLGDVNADGVVDGADRDLLGTSAGLLRADAFFPVFGDANLDGVINELDLSAVGYFWTPLVVK